MNQSSEIPISVLLPSDGRTVHAFGDEMTFLIEGKHNGGKCTVLIEVTSPGGGPPPHYHQNEDEWFYVLEGRAAFFKDGAWTEVPPGTSVFIPKGMVHTFKNVGDQPLRQLITVSPSGFEIFMTRCAEEFAKLGPPDMQRIIAISAEHNIHYVNS